MTNSKRILTLLILLTCINPFSRADEGMWLPLFIKRLNHTDMQKMGLTFNMQKYYAGISESILEIKEQAFTKLKENATKLNANAVVGIQVDVELKSSEGLIAVMIIGTAVSIVKR